MKTTLSSMSTAHALPRRPGSWALLALLAACTTARADIPPPPGYVETCTVERQCPNDEVDFCYASFRTRDACSQSHQNDGFKLACKTRGASVWRELWCRPAASKPAARPASAAKSP